MSENQNIHFKDCRPEETLSKLKNILNSMNIEVEEESKLKSKIGTYSSRVVFKGTSTGSNGKGVSEAYCNASAYAEFFERYQNDLGMIYNVNRPSKYSFYRTFDERLMRANEIISDNNAFINFYFKQRNMTECSVEEKSMAFDNIQKLDWWSHGLEDEHVTIPFFNVRDKKVKYLPYFAYMSYYGSNGMCAGNTPEEALVQGLAEIYERVAQRRIFLERPTLPDVPDEYVKKFPHVYELLLKLRENENYVYKIKDCSFGGKYPVAALLIIEKNTGNYGIKLGCHPDFGVAIERCFTEAAQGGDIYEYINRSVVDFNNTAINNYDNISNSYKVGMAQFPYQIFGSECTYEFTPVKDVSNKTNAEILNDWIKQTLNDGYDVLIRDVSYTGFPSYHIIIPGLSELQEYDDKRFRAANTKMFARVLLSEPSRIDKKNMEYIIATLNYFARSIIENDIDQYFMTAGQFKYPGEENSCELYYLIAMCYIYLEDYINAEKTLNIMQKKNKTDNVEHENRAFYNAVYYYVSAMKNIGNHTNVMAYIATLFDSEITEKINYIFGDCSKVIEKQYPHVNIDPDDMDNPYNILFDAHEKLLDSQVRSKIKQEDLCKYFS